VHEKLPVSELAGRVVAVPVANPVTFDRVGYTAPASLDSVNGNMNRVWPGDDEGSLHERMAATLWEFVADADAVVDLHTGSPDLLTHVVYPHDDADARALAEAFGTDLLLGERRGEDAPDEWHRRDFDGKLRVAAAREGIPAITPELAHCRELVEPAVEAGVRGVLNVCRHLGVLDGQPITTDPVVARNHLGRVDAADSGLFRPNPALDLGERVDAGDAVGTVYDPSTYEVLHRATFDRDGLLYAIAREATVKAGDRLASVAITD
jgi:predicted deacylase